MIQILFNISWVGQSPFEEMQNGPKTRRFHGIKTKEQESEK